MRQCVCNHNDPTDPLLQSAVPNHHSVEMVMTGKELQETILGAARSHRVQHEMERAVTEESLRTPLSIPFILTEDDLKADALAPGLMKAYAVMSHQHIAERLELIAKYLPANDIYTIHFSELMELLEGADNQRFPGRAFMRG